LCTLFDEGRSFRRSPEGGEVTSMRRVNRFGPIAALAVTMWVVPAFAGGVTVGRFYSAVAQAKQLISTDEASSEASLRAAGFELPQIALDKNLTEGDLTAISKALGVAVTTHRSSQPVSASQLDTYLSVFAARLRASARDIGNPQSISGDDQGDDNDDQGRPHHSRSKP
jgi:hypothetical protein